MKAIIQEAIFNRAKHIFEASKITFVLSKKRDVKSILKLQEKHLAKCIVVDSRFFAKTLFENLLPQTLIARFGTGYNNIPLDICKKQKLFLANTPNVLAETAAEFAMGAMLCLLRKIAFSHTHFLKKKWSRLEGTSLRGKTLGILGFGAVGQSLAKMASEVFGMEVVACGNQKSVSEKNLKFLSRYYSQNKKEMDLFLKKIDILSLHLSLTKQTHHLIDAKHLSLLKPGAFVINTSRGDIVDEAALYKNLKEGRLSGAALDVFSNEPYFPQLPKNDFRTLGNVILTPHIAANTDAANEKVAQKTIENIECFYKKKYEKVAFVGDFLPQKKGETNFTTGSTFL